MTGPRDQTDPNGQGRGWARPQKELEGRSLGRWFISEVQAEMSLTVGRTQHEQGKEAIQADSLDQEDPAAGGAQPQS